MATVMIKCPKTNLPLSTGMGMDQQAFESATLEGNSVSCPHCGDVHTWDKADATLVGDE